MPGGGRTSSGDRPEGLDTLRSAAPVQPAGAIRRTRLLNLIPIRNIGGPGAFFDFDAQVRVRTPSARLLASLTIGFRPDNAEDSATTAPFAGLTVSADQWTQTDTGIWVKGNHIRNLTVSPATDTFPVPWSYEWASTAGELRVLIHIPATGSGLPEDGNFYAIARWEPAPGAQIADSELYTLLSACNLQVDRSIQVFESDGE